MFCPKCGTLQSDDQKFCRACGLGLQEVSASVKRSIALASSNQPASSDKPVETRGDLQRRGILITLVSLLVGCLIPIAAGLSNFYPWTALLIPVIAGVAGLILFTGAMIIVYAASSPSLPRKRAVSELPDLPGADTTPQLEPPPGAERAPTVTEGTTEFFEQHVVDSTHER